MYIYIYTYVYLYLLYISVYIIVVGMRSFEVRASPSTPFNKKRRSFQRSGREFRHSISTELTPGEYTLLFVLEMPTGALDSRGQTGTHQTFGHIKLGMIFWLFTRWCQMWDHLWPVELAHLARIIRRVSDDTGLNKTRSYKFSTIKSDYVGVPLDG